MPKIPRPKRRSAKFIHHIGNTTNFAITSPFGILHLSYSTKTGTPVEAGTEESQETSDETIIREEIRVFITIHSSGILSAIGLNLGVQIALSNCLAVSIAEWEHIVQFPMIRLFSTWVELVTLRLFENFLTIDKRRHGIQIREASPLCL